MKMISYIFHWIHLKHTSDDIVSVTILSIYSRWKQVWRAMFCLVPVRNAWYQYNSPTKPLVYCLIN